MRKQLINLIGNQVGIIRSISVDKTEIERIASLGICIGRKVTVVRSGPFMVIDILGTRFGVEEGLAEKIMLEIPEEISQTALQALRKII